MDAYLNDYFPGRLPKGVKVTWEYWSGDDGLTTTQNINDPKSPLLVQIPRKWGFDPCGFLYDCVDHELVHINDYASSRAKEWNKQFDEEGMEAIMEYRAYSRNLEYSAVFPTVNPRMFQDCDYGYHLKVLVWKMKLPPGYKP